MINTQENYFQLFSLAENFDIELANLQLKFRELQAQIHPDNFIGRDQELASQALIASSLINQAYTTLLNPLSRAMYLLQLKGIIIDLVHETNFKPEFLMQQIELREEIDSSRAANDIDKLEKIEDQLKQQIQSLIKQISCQFEKQDYQEVIPFIKELAFYNKLELLLNDILNSL